MISLRGRKKSLVINQPVLPRYCIFGLHGQESVNYFCTTQIFFSPSRKYFWTHLIPNIFLLSVWWYFLMLVSTSSVIEIMNQIFWGDLRLPQDVHTTNNQYIVKKYIQSVMNVVFFTISGGWCWCQKNNLLNLLLQFSGECVFSVFLLFLSKLGNWI